MRTLYVTDLDGTLLNTRDRISPLVYSYVQGRESVSWNTSRENEGIRRYLSKRKGDRRRRPLEDARGLYDGDVFYYTCMGEKEELMPLYELFSRDGVAKRLERHVCFD